MYNVLQVFKAAQQHKNPDFIQREPKRVVLPHKGQHVAMTVDNESEHYASLKAFLALLKSSST